MTWRPSPHPVPPGQPPIGGMVDVPDLSFPEQPDGGGSYLDHLGEIFATHPFQAPDPRMMPSPLAAFLVNLAGGYGNAQGARFRAGPNNPATKIALGHLNMQQTQVDAKREQQAGKDRLDAAREASKTLNDHKKSLAEERKQAEQTPGTPEYEDAINRKAQTKADELAATKAALVRLGLPLTGALKPPAPPKKPKGTKPEKTPVQIADRKAQIAAATDSTFRARGLKQPKTYVEDKIAQAMLAGMTAQEFAKDVEDNRRKLQAAGFNPDSLIERGARSLRKQ